MYCKVQEKTHIFVKNLRRGKPVMSMKTLVIFFLLIGAGLNASAMGHPHNLFSAHRKAKQYKPIVCKTTTVTDKRTFTNCVKVAAPSVIQTWVLLRKKLI